MTCPSVGASHIKQFALGVEAVMRFDLVVSAFFLWGYLSSG